MIEINRVNPRETIGTSFYYSIKAGTAMGLISYGIFFTSWVLHAFSILFKLIKLNREPDQYSTEVSDKEHLGSKMLYLPLFAAACIIPVVLALLTIVITLAYRQAKANYSLRTQSMFRPGEGRAEAEERIRILAEAPQPPQLD